jgi:hypothetical protein
MLDIGVAFGDTGVLRHRGVAGTRCDEAVRPRSACASGGARANRYGAQGRRYALHAHARSASEAKRFAPRFELADSAIGAPVCKAPCSSSAPLDAFDGAEISHRGAPFTAVGEVLPNFAALTERLNIISQLNPTPKDITTCPRQRGEQNAGSPDRSRAYRRS